MGNYLCVLVGGGAGSLTRYLVNRAILRAYPTGNFALGTFIINVTGSFLDALGAVSVLPREYPGWMFETQGARGKILAEIGRKNAR